MNTPDIIQGVKELRERTGAPILKCKSALEESAGSIEDAIELLLKKGWALRTETRWPLAVYRPLRTPDVVDGWKKVGDGVELGGVRIERGEDGLIMMTNALNLTGDADS